MNEPWEWLGLQEAVEAWPEYGRIWASFDICENPRFALIFTGTDDHPGEDLLFARTPEGFEHDTIYEAGPWSVEGSDSDWLPVSDQEAIKFKSDGTKTAAKAHAKKRLGESKAKQVIEAEEP